jgi:hypothetical protein
VGAERHFGALAGRGHELGGSLIAGTHGEVWVEVECERQDTSRRSKSCSLPSADHSKDCGWRDSCDFTAEVHLCRQGVRRVR